MDGQLKQLTKGTVGETLNIISYKFPLSFLLFLWGKCKFFHISFELLVDQMFLRNLFVIFTNSQLCGYILK